MSTTVTARPSVHYKHPSAVRNIAVSFAEELDEGEVITGTPTVSVSPSGPTLSAAAATTTVRKINGVTVEAGRAVTFTASGGSDGVDYVITVTAATSGSQTIPVICNLSVRAT